MSGCSREALSTAASLPRKGAEQDKQAGTSIE